MDKSINILHLEDENDVVELVHRLLLQEKYQPNITHVENRSEFISEIVKQTYDIIIADYSLPDFDGLTALNLVRNVNQEVPFIIFSGSIGEEKAIESLRNGATDYVLKQNVNALIPTINRALKISSTQKEEKKFKNALLHSEALFRSTIEHLPLGALVANLKGNIIMANNAFCEMCLLSKSEIVNKVKIDSFEPFIEAGINAFFSDLYLEQKNFDFDSPQITTKNGEKIYLACRGNSIKNSLDEVTSYLVLLDDITEKKRKDLALLQSEEKHRLITQAAADAIVTINDTGKIVSWNKAAEKIFGISRDKILEKNISTIMPKRFKSKHTKGLGGLKNGVSEKLIGETVELVGLHKNKTEFPIELSISRWQKENEKFYTGIIRDITERKKVEEKISKYTKLFKESLNEIYIFDAKTFKYLEANQAAQDNIGYNMQELSQLTPVDIRLAINRDSFEKIVSPMINGQTKKTIFETKHRRKNGTLYDVEVHLQISSIADKQIFIAIVLDISDRIHAKKIQDSLFKITSAGINSNTQKKLYRTIKDELEEIIHINNFFIGLYDKKNETISFPFMEDEKDHFEDVPLENTISGYVIKNNKPLLLSGPEVDQFVADQGIKRIASPALCWLGVPLVTKEEVIGIIVIQSYSDANAYTKTDLNLMKFVANQIASVIQQKKTESNLLKASRALEQSPSSIVITDLKGDIEYVNPKFCKVTGYSAEEVFGQNPRVLKSGETTGEEYQHLWDVVSNGQIWNGRFHNKRKDGTKFWEDATIGPIKDEHGKITNYMAIKEDISEKLEVENQLKKAHAQNEQLFSSFPSSLIVMDSDETIIRWNKKAEESFGISEKDAVNKKLLETGITWDWSAIVTGIGECRFNNSTVVLNDIEYTAPDEKSGILNLTISPFGKDSNIRSKFLILGQDITQQKVLESQLSQAQKLESIGQLAAGIAHEINTPTQFVGDNTNFLKDAFTDFNNLINQFETLSDANKNSEKTEDLIEGIDELKEQIDLEYLLEEVPVAIDQSLEGIARVTKIVRAMKEFSHPGAKEKTLIDINKSILNTTTVCKNEWKYVSDIVTELDESLPPVPCIPGAFNQVILNLVINAAHAIGESLKTKEEEKGIINITTNKIEDMVEIRIKDSGTGIPESAQEKIFDPFFTTKEVGKGTGQGLAISHDVITKKHNGTINFETEKNQGTTFIIKIPMN